MRESELRREHSPIVELIGLVEAQRLLQARISECVAACCEHGYGATEVARILRVHRATVYRQAAWRKRLEKMRPEMAEALREDGRGS